jgi:hypothetical protein
MPPMKICTQLPLRELTDDLGNVIAARGARLSESDIKELLRESRTSFIVADVGHPLREIAKDDTHSFWKSEVKPLLSSKEGARLEECPGEYFYWATEFKGISGATIIVLEKQH